MHVRHAWIAFAAAGLAACAPRPLVAPAPGPDAAAEVVAAERAFEAAVARDGVRDAFLAFADDSAIAFRPEPVNAKEWWRAAPAGRGVNLKWYPVFAIASASGDLGFSTGPYEVLDSAGTVRGAGNYSTVWRRAPAGWRFMIDQGAPNPVPATRPAPWSGPSPRRATVTPGDADASASLLAADRAFSARVAQAGLASALAAVAAPEIRILRTNRFPAVGAAQAAAWATADSARRHTFTPARAFASRAGDLGWTYGEYQSVHPGAGRRESGHYLRVWTREGSGPWRLLFDVVSPRPGERDE